MSCPCEQYDLRRLNSLTKYPAIPTLHAMGDRGRLGDLAVTFPEGAAVWATEKIDGANARVLALPWGCWIVGSREEFIAHKGDLLRAKTERIVEAVAPLLDRLAPGEHVAHLTVWYGEVYGAKVGQGAKNYASEDRLGFRIFDAWQMGPDDLFTRRDKPLEEIAAWRDAGGQPFLPLSELASKTAARNVERVPPVLAGVLRGDALRLDHSATLALLKGLVPASQAALDDQARKHAEGVVFRTEDRKVIAKARFEDYERALR